MTTSIALVSDFVFGDTTAIASSAAIGLLFLAFCTRCPCAAAGAKGDDALDFCLGALPYGVQSHWRQRAMA